MARVTQKHITKILEVAYHRNGISGVGFHVVTFDTAEYGEMLATVFPETGAVAVLGFDGLNTGDIAFGSNSWRGDHYEPELRAAIAAYEASR